jgi:hypothetical protein
MKTIKLSLIAFSALMSFSSCSKDPVIEAPSIVGNWKVDKVKIISFSSGTQFWDTTVNNVTDWLGVSYYYNFKADKSFEDKSVEKNTGNVTSSVGTYNLNGSNLTLNYKDLTVEEFENVSFDASRLVMTIYDPSKTDPDRTISTWECSRQ